MSKEFSEISAGFTEAIKLAKGKLTRVESISQRQLT